ncbi:helix-turn-helix transcriptional regulator [Akkermansia glycaniphila]|uniref:helix-turn-helix domain-containing protein n=1 Tax=Akkermansia glycaniphila TaxID=1679444 RepID=UPI001C01D33E|nr:helix-turn-helix transcriptional regulator [Akkermansia glycaniphila]MBT9450701.1 helix-turn-helix transcriptional regulator [Akkermansia glycaniphila]
MNTSIQKAFGKCIRDFRLKTELSQEKFALMINMDRTYYASVESGKRNISIVNIQKITIGLGISLSKLFLAIENYEENIV